MWFTIVVFVGYICGKHPSLSLTEQRMFNTVISTVSLHFGIYLLISRKTTQYSMTLH